MTRVKTWTQEILTWEPWVPALTDEAITPAHEEVLGTFPPAQGKSPYYRVLANEPRVLRARTDLFDASLKSDEGISRADRELAAVGSSRGTGCIYCASVHARAYSGLTHDKTVVQKVLDEGPDADIPDRERAIVQFSAKLGTDPDKITASDLQPLRAVGFDDLQILDITYSAAVFANANRLMLSLGQGLEP